MPMIKIIIITMKIIVLFHFNLPFLPIKVAVSNESSFLYFVFFQNLLMKNIILKINLGRPLVSKLTNILAVIFFFSTGE